MKTTVTDFEQEYKAYTVATGQSGAHANSSGNRRHSSVLTTMEAQALYGDASAQSVVNNENFSGQPMLLESNIHMVTLRLTFNEVVRMAAVLAKKNGGAKMSDLPDNCGDKLSQAFSACAAEHGLTPLNKFFVTSRSLLEAVSPHELPKTEQGMGDDCMEKPNETVACFDEAGKVLKDMQIMLLFNECDFPGSASGNLYYVSGLYAEPPKETRLPVTEQNKTPLAMVMQELHRTLK